MPVLATSLVSLKVEEPYLPPRNWESLPSQSGRFLPPTRSSASSSSSSSFVSESSLVRLALNALQGVESSLISIEQLSSAFCSEPADRTFHKIPSLWHRLSSTDALGQILRDIGCFGSLVFLLHKFVDHFTRLNLDVESAVEGQGSCKIGENEEVNNKSCYTLVNQAFAIAVRRVLEGYISGLDTLCASIELRRSSNIVDGSDHGSSRLGSLTNVVHPKITLLEVFLHTRELRTQIEALANICDLYDIALSYCASPWECLITEATTRFHGFYRGSDLLTYLYSQLQVADPTHSAMLKFLFLKTCEPYCEFIRSWMFKAELNDPHKEFIVECRSESTSFSWNKPGISPLKSVRERGGLVPCFLNGFLEPIVRAGQQLQVITKLLELCNLPASGHKNYTDLLPCWTYFSTTSPGYPSPITFSKLHIEVMIKKRDDYYRMMQEKLGDFSEKFEVFPGQVPGAISLPISYGDGDKNSIYFTLDESLLIPSTMAIDLTRDQSGSDSDDQNTEDRWFSEIDASCSSECSSTRDSLEASEHSDSGYIDNNLVRQGEKADINHQWVDTKPEESTGVCEDDKFRGPLLIKSWPLGGLPRNPFCVDKKSADDDSEDPRNYSGARMEQRHLMNTDERKLFLNNISTSGSCSKHERRHDVLENCLSSKLDLMKDTKVNYPNDVLSMNPLVRCDFLRKHGNTNKRNQGKSLPWFDFSAVDDPSKTCITRIPVRVPIDFQKESHSPQTDRKSHRHANQERFDVEDPKVSSSQLSSGIKGCAEEKKSNAFGGGRWESMLRRSNNPETSAFSDRRQDSSGTFELPLDFVIDKCLLQEIHLQYNFVSKLAIKLLEEGFGLQEHLLALRRYHFMELADWADVFVVSLWHHKWLVTEADKRIAEIQGFLESSIQRSSCERDICKDRIFLYKRQGTMHIPPSTIGVRSFDFLRLGYRVDWPISIILTCDALTAYADVFSFLVQVKLAAYVLTDVWCSLKDVRHMMHEKKEKILKQELRWLNILMKLRHQVNHFVTALQQYVHSELSHVSWSKFLHSLKNKVKDMMDLESVHMAYLSEALRICFLSDETQIISNIIENILQCALDFRSCLPRGIQSTDRVPNDSWTKTLGINTSQVMMVKQNFDKELKELHKCHLRSPKHGKYGLSRFWDYLNFNLYYSDILHDSNIFSLIP
ncbi:Spc97 / Spc98 family of spindle pole body (SBP) component [Arabidopsis thaliana]|uniref:Spc97 / Spc98 family of spindle pole body (SBP) component n=1 Tax=Arabidopsis thaliana TaxID=3702 RepID=A0A1I9LLJ4_ARATH|nr:Spc97 / Spc98 family of spindle pole body (SBP) component [Arabidopsis thaliana]ANM63452.1 Spc97 / Spc98 family of spindle pole body (SBP) component [Arabidopsis thaliana]|eukprot:NP_001325538.1 Spc97 / Spc98 family of spindle pole body (SBP) component [Arabidopsis thaliana]